MTAGGDPTPVLEVCHATLVRGTARVLEDVSFRIARGAHTAVLGPNGAGKSSLLRLLAFEDRALHRAEPPVRWFGRDRWDVSELRAHVGIVSLDLDQRFAAGTRAGRVSGLEAAVSGLLGSHAVFSNHRVAPAMWARAQAALGRAGAAHLADRMVHTMSAGERRRVLIARALVNDPHTLLLDEPTTGLDFVARHHFLETVRTLARAGTTLVLVTHHVEEVVPEIGRVILLAAGRVAFDGPRADALTPARLADVFGATVEMAPGVAPAPVPVDGGPMVPESR